MNDRALVCTMLDLGFVCDADGGQRALLGQRGGRGEVQGELGQCEGDCSSFLEGKEELGV